MAGVSETRTIDALLTTTLAYHSKQMRDQIFDDYPLLSWFDGRLGRVMRPNRSLKRMQAGGESIVEHLMYEQNSTIDSQSGSAVIDTTPQEGMTIARYNWKYYAGAVTITWPERNANRGEEKLISLLGAKTNQAVMSFRDRLSVDAWGDGTGNGSQNLTGMQAHGSTTTTTGGIAPGTYSWWQANTSTSVGSFAANGESEMRTMYNNISFGTQKPEIIFCDQTTHEYFEASQTDRRRYTSERVANAGFDNIMFKSAPVVFDRDCPSGSMYFMNPDVWSWVVDPDADVTTGEFVTPYDHATSTAKILFQGNLTVNNRRKVGVLSGITA